MGWAGIASAQNAPKAVGSGIPDQVAMVGVEFNYTVPETTFIDPDGDTLSYGASLWNGDPLPSWLTFTPSTRTFSGTPTSNVPISFGILVFVLDNKDGNARISFNIVINEPPTVANAILDQGATQGVAFSYTIPANTFSDAQGHALAYTITQILDPDGDAVTTSWLSFDAATRTLSGTPASGGGDNGSWRITVTASDGYGGSVSDEFQVRVNTTNQVVSITGGSAVTEGTAASFTVSRATATASGVVVYLSVSEDTTGGQDYVASGNKGYKSVTIPANATSVTYTVATVGDSTDELDGAVTVAIRNSLTYSIAATGRAARVPVTDDDGVPTVTITSFVNALNGTGQIAEGTTSAANLLISVSPPFPTGGQEFYPVNIGTRNADGSAQTGSINFRANQQAGGVNIQHPEDTIIQRDGHYDMPVWISPNADLYKIAVGSRQSDTIHTIEVTDNDKNTEPTVATAIPDQTGVNAALLGSFYEYTVPANTFSDTDGHTLTYSATLGNGNPLPSWLIFTPSTRTFSGLIPVDAATPLEWTIKVTADDGYGGSVSDPFILGINGAVTLANALPDQIVAVGSAAFRYTIPETTFNDANGDTLTYTASGTPSWLSFDATTRTVSGTPQATHVGTSTITVTASDGNGSSASDMFTLEVVTEPPMVSITTVESPILEGSAIGSRITVSVDKVLTGGSGNIKVPIRGRRADGSLYSQTAQILAGKKTGFARVQHNDDDIWHPDGHYDMKVWLGSWTKGEGALYALDTDSNGEANTTHTVRVTDNDANTPPTVVDAIPDQTATVDVAFSYEVPAATFSDANGHTLSYSATQSDGSALPDWLSFDAATRIFSGELMSSTAGTVTVRVTADDGNGGTVSDDFDIAVNVRPTVPNPIPDQVGSLSAVAGSSYSYTFPANTFSDTDGDTLTYRANLGFAAGWLSFDAATRTFSGAPMSDWLLPDPYTITVTATDGKGGEVSDTFDIFLNAPPRVANAIPDQTATVWGDFRYEVPADTFDDLNLNNMAQTLSYSATLSNDNALPAWLSFDTESRTFSGTPTSAKTWTLRVTADDGHGGVVSDDFDLVVGTSDLPVVSITGGIAVTEGTAASFTVTRTGDTTAALTVLLSVSEDTTGGQDYVASSNEGDKSIAIPSGSASVTYTVATVGDNTDEPDGTVTVSIRTSSGYISTTTSANVTVNDDDGAGNSAPTVANPIPDQTATVRTNFSYAFPANTFSDPDGDPLTYTATLSGGGTLPTWLTFTPTNRNFSGSPTSAETLTIQVTASDGNGNSVTDTFTITVSAGNSAPSVANAIPDRTATVGTLFSYAFPTDTFSDPDGDTLTYTATVPSWLRFEASSQTFSGTPEATHVGTHTVTVTADDGNGETVPTNFNIEVTHTTPVVSFATSSAMVEEGESIDVTLNLNPAPTSDITITYEVSGSAEGSDYNALSGTVFAGAGAEMVTFSIDSINDDLYESSETVVLTLSADTNSPYTLGSSKTYTLTIKDNEPRLRITPTELPVTEGESDFYSVRLTHAPSSDVTVTITKTGDTDNDLEISIDGADADAENSGQDENQDPPPPLTLEFDADNYDEPKKVIVRAMEDEDNINEEITITHEAEIGSEIPRVEVTVTIKDNDITPSQIVKAGLVRFGRTVGEQSVSAIKDRLTQPPLIGFHGSLVGHTLATSQRATSACATHSLQCSHSRETGSVPSHDLIRPGNRLPVDPDDPLASIRGLASPGDASRVLTLEEMVAGTSFAMTREQVGGKVVSVWGQGSRSGFAGRQGEIGFDGDVTGFMLGWDVREGDRLHGVMVSQTGGDIPYRTDAGMGATELELTAVIPYAARTVRTGMRVWGALGFGSGKLTHREEGEDPVRADMDWRMAAFGVSGDLPSVEGLSGAALSWHADGLWTQTGVDAASDDGKSWSAFDGATLRSRMGVVAAWQQVLGNGSVVRPSLEVGLRHDAGDAERGFGVEIGGSLAWSNPAMPGVSLIVRGRKLVIHAEDSFDDWGASIALVYDPSPKTREGVSARVSHALGGLSPDSRPMLGGDVLPASEGLGMERNWTMEIAHGTAVGQGRVGSPYLAVREGTTERTTRLGYRMEPDLDQEQEYRIDVWAEPKESGDDGTGSGRAGLSLSTRW